jgi:hypothetical protein
MVALSVHLLALTSAFVPVPVAQPPAEYYAYQPVPQFLGRSDVVMNTKYGDPNVRAYKKKDPRTGSTLNLKGYTVGSRAPASSRASGTINQFGYGIDNLYGGKRIVKAAQADSEGLPTSFSVGGGGRATPSSLTKAGPALLAAALFFLVASLK